MQEQEVEIYYDVVEAATDMRKRIRNGWRVHICTMGTCKVGYERNDKLLVVYER